jgi:plasmid stabilization system protein ParE
LVEQILDDIESLKIFPHRNVVQPARGANPPLRSLPLGSYVVYFRVLEETRVVRVARVRHGAQQRPYHFE